MMTETVCTMLTTVVEDERPCSGGRVVYGWRSRTTALLRLSSINASPNRTIFVPPYISHRTLKPNGCSPAQFFTATVNRMGSLPTGHRLFRKSSLACSFCFFDANRFRSTTAQ